MPETNSNPVLPLAAAAERFPDQIALTAGKASLAHGELHERARRLATRLRPALRNRRVGILGSRSLEAYVGILAAMWAGATYVPLNLKWPASRLVELMGELELDALVTDANGEKLLSDDVLAAAPGLIIGAEEAMACTEAPMGEPARRRDADLAYIVFTSGSTGTPKGVMVSNRSLSLYLRETRKWTKLTSGDRVAEAHDVTFDLSVHNLFLTLEAGASLRLMSPLDMMAPHAFIRRHEATVWMSVPTLVNNLRRAGTLKPDMLPSLRLSIFCGEPLAVATCADWQAAAPNSRIENIYGPTECTVVCTRQTYTDPPLVTPERDILAIGPAYDGFDIVIRDEAGVPVPEGTSGEITLCAAQLSDGYWKRPDQNAKAFRTLADGSRWYFTGDRGYRDGNGVFHHMGRVDNQVKLKGNRVELEEVEVHLRRAAATDVVAVVPWPVVDNSVQGLVGFALDTGRTGEDVRRAMTATLPEYMIPARVEIRSDMPRNINDKVDRKALAALLEAPSMETPDAAKEPVGSARQQA